MHTLTSNSRGPHTKDIFVVSIQKQGNNWIFVLDIIEKNGSLQIIVME